MAGRKPEVEDREILEQFVESGEPAFGANELAEMVDMSRQGVDYRLRDLEEEGLVASKIVSRDRIWWITDKGLAHLGEPESSE